MSPLLWLPSHENLNVEHRPLESSGSFTGGGWKWVWHYTVSSWNSVDAMYGVLRDKRAAPHFVIGGRPGTRHPVVIQMLPMNEAGRALVHGPGGETNRANCIQVEVCATEEIIRGFHDWQYQALANLVKLSGSHVPHRLARHFNDTRRFGPQEFVNVSGHCGHLHVPGNDHTDPGTHFDGSKVMRMVNR